MRSTSVLIFFCAGLWLLPGCSGCCCNSESPAEHFNRTQTNTKTPHGRVIPGSAESAGDGKIRYQTGEGKKVEVTATPQGEGYRYSDPKQVK
jgi:hypothetical protein